MEYVALIFLGNVLSICVRLPGVSWRGIGTPISTASRWWRSSCAARGRGRQTKGAWRCLSCQRLMWQRARCASWLQRAEGACDKATAGYQVIHDCTHKQRGCPMTCVSDFLSRCLGYTNTNQKHLQKHCLKMTCPVWESAVGSFSLSTG